MGAEDFRTAGFRTLLHSRRLCRRTPGGGDRLYSAQDRAGDIVIWVDVLWIRRCGRSRILHAKSLPAALESAVTSCPAYRRKPSGLSSVNFCRVQVRRISVDDVLPVGGPTGIMGMYVPDAEQPANRRKANSHREWDIIIHHQPLLRSRQRCYTHYTRLKICI